MNGLLIWIIILLQHTQSGIWEAGVKMGFSYAGIDDFDLIF